MLSCKSSSHLTYSPDLTMANVYLFRTIKEGLRWLIFSGRYLRQSWKVLLIIRCIDVTESQHTTANTIKHSWEMIGSLFHEIVPGLRCARFVGLSIFPISHCHSSTTAPYHILSNTISFANLLLKEEKKRDIKSSRTMNNQEYRILHLL
jgi:hypothetical protein